MKKFFTVLSILFCATFLFAGNGMFYYRTDAIYQYTVDLCIEAGVIGPSSSTPVSSDELLFALNRIDSSRLSSTSQVLLSELFIVLDKENENFAYDIDLEISPVFYGTDDYMGDGPRHDSRSEFFIPYQEEKPFAKLGLDLHFGNFILSSAFEAKNSPFKKGMAFSSFDWLINFRGGKFNFMGDTGKKEEGTFLYGEIPTFAMGGYSNRNFNMVLGRTHHEMGTGYTGNLVIGDNFNYQELLKIGFTSEPFTYNLSITHFDSEKTVMDEDGNPFAEVDHTRFGGKHQVRVIHRFDVTPIDSFRASLLVGSLFYSDSAFDLRFLTPFMMTHNYYNFDEHEIVDSNARAFDEANNILGLELEWTPINRLNISGQICVDQFQLPWENSSDLPGAFGVLLNATWLQPIKDGSVKIWIEGVYTSPYLYLNKKYDGSISNEKRNYNYDWKLGYFRNIWADAEHAYSGYLDGPDTIVFALGADYKNRPLNLEVNNKLYFKVQGEKQKDPWLDNDFANNLSPKGNPEYTIGLESICNYEILNDELTLFAGLNLAYAINYNCRGFNSFIPQGMIGVTWKIL